jgi:DNA-binding response OmpR family regulator
MLMTDHRLPSAYASAQPLRIAMVTGDAMLRQEILLPDLRTHGFTVHGASSAAELYRHMLSLKFDIVVLDIGLPDESGLAVTQHLRSMSDIGIVVLTSGNDRKHHVQALRAGADVYLTRPDDIDVLAATLHNLGRRLTTRAPDEETFAAPVSGASRWRLEDGGWRLASPRGRVIALALAEQCVATMLAAEDGQPVSRETLLLALNRRAQEFDAHRLEMIIHRLRRKVHAHTSERLPLITVRGMGYLFSCDMAAVAS